MGDDKFAWEDGDLVFLSSCSIAVVIDGDAQPWYGASWDPATGIDAAAILVDGMTGAPRFNPSERGPNGEVAEVERVLLADVGQWGMTLYPETPVPDGMATELRVTGDAEATIALV